MGLTSVSIRRPVFILMVVAALIVLGLNSVSKMRLELNPKVELPVVAVNTTYPGAGPEEIETQITKKVEDAVAGVNNIKNITSSSQEGLSSVTINFEYGTDNEVAASDVREKVSAIRASLPTASKEPVISKFDFNSQPVIYYGLTGNRPLRDLRDLADNVIKQRLSKVPGAAAVTISGGDVREISVGVKKERLDAYGITINQLVQLIQGNNINFPAGHIVEQDREYSVRVVGEFPDVPTIAASRLHMPNGQTVRLSEIADIQDTIEERRNATRVNRQDSVAIVVQKTAEGNTVDVAKGIRAEVAKLQKDLPQDIKFILNQDLSTNVEDNLDDVKNSLFLGAFLAVLVVFLFLHNIRGTFIVAIAIPTSVLATFLPIFSFGFTLNSMTLLALSLSVGILVDDSIVVLENIYRHLARGEEPIEASLNGRGEIGLAAITITMVDVVVFLPIAFMGGVSGQFFRSFGITVAVATLFSLFMSFTLTPMLASRWYRSGEGNEAVHGVFGLINTFYRWLDRIYHRVLAWALKFRGIIVYASSGALVLVFVAIIASVAGKGFFAAGVPLAIFFGVFGLILNWRYKLLGLLVTAGGIAAVFLAIGFGVGVGHPLLLFRFAPEQDQGQVSVTGELPAGTSLAKTTEIVKQIEDEIADNKDVANIFTSIGATSTGQQGGAANYGTQYFVLSLKLRDKKSLGTTLNPFAKSDNLRTLTDEGVAKVIREKLGKKPGVTLKVAAVSGFAAGAPLQIDLRGISMKELAPIADKVLQIFKEEPGTENVDISTRLGKPEQRIVVDREKAASFGLSIVQISDALRVSLEGDDNVKLRDNGNEYAIRVHFSDLDRKNVNDLGSIVVGSVQGNTPVGGGAAPMLPVRLADVADIRSDSGPTKIDRLDRQQTIAVTASLQPGFAPGNMQLNIEKKLANINFGTNTWAWGGENKTQADEGKYIVAALGLAVILVYMLMAALFDNLVYPLVIMLSLPQAFVGALLGLMAFGHALTIVAFIGIIMLIGLVTKNAILLVDYTNTLRERGMSRTDAILEAGPTRLRPILMTTIAMIFGMLPTALGIGRGSEFRAPLGSPVIGGLLLSTLLTLLVIPCVYTYFDDFTSFIGRRLFRRKLEPEKPAGTRPERPEPTPVD